MAAPFHQSPSAERTIQNEKPSKDEKEKKMRIL